MTDVSIELSDRASSAASHGHHQITTTPEQALHGLTVDEATREVLCIGCGRTLRESEDCVVYAYRAVDAPAWVVARWYCLACAPATIRGPTLGTAELLVKATLMLCSRAREQAHQLCLGRPELQAFCRPDTGDRP